MGPDGLADLVETRHEVGGDEYELARKAWAAYRSRDPRALEELLTQDVTALPYLQEAFQMQQVLIPLGAVAWMLASAAILGTWGVLRMEKRLVS